MVLSNKKLKQKLREALAVTLAAKEESKEKDPKSQTKSFKELLDSTTEKPRLSKREKRRKVLPFKADEDTQMESKDGSEVLSEKKKRKRDEDGGVGGSGVAELNEEKKKKKKEKKKKGKGEGGVEKEGGEANGEKPVKTLKKKKKKKRNNKKSKKEEIKGVEPGNAEVKEEEPVVEEVIQSHENTGIQENAESQENIASQESTNVTTKVYVGGIPYYSTEEDIQSFFEGCGTITEMDCMTFPDTGKFRGIAVITFKTEAAAKRALALDGADMGGLFLKIQPYKTSKANNKVPDFTPKIIEGYNRAYLGNLSWDITEEDLKQLFSDCKISSIRFGTDKETGEFRGYAHVDFSDSESLTAALKLDQRVVCGRPVRITCAVPKKQAEKQSVPSTINKKTENASLSASGDKKKKRACYECGLPGHLSAACPNKQAENAKQAEDVGLSSGGGEKKRRTCYECGIPGHISSACPNKHVENPNKHVENPNKQAENPKQAEDANLSSSGGEKKRRTCYECGIPGHISSACPKKQAENPNKQAENPKQVEDANLSSGGGEMKKRTCYECGDPGHLSSACPNKQTENAEQAENLSLSTGGEKKKKKRRTCYMCGVPGHLSSDCPNKQAADPVNSNSK